MRRTRKLLRTSRFQNLILVTLGGLLICLFFGHSALASAVGGDPGGDGLSTDSPIDGSGRFLSSDSSTGNFTTAGQSIQPYYDIGNNGQDYTYGSMNVKAYVNKAWGGSVTVTVTNAADDCYSASGGGVVGPDYYQVGGAFTTVYTILGAGGYSQSKSIRTGGCAASVPFSVPVSKAYSITPTPYGASIPDFDGFFYVQAAVSQGQNEGENSFRVTMDAGSNWGLTSSGSTTYGIGYRDNNLNLGHYFNAWSTFALPVTCNDYNSSASVARSISVLDIDANHSPVWNDDVILLLQGAQVNSANTPNTIGGWSTVASRTQGQGFNNNGQTWTFNYNFQYNHIYRLALINFGVRNTVRVQMDNTLSPLYSKLAERPSDALCSGTSYSYSCFTNPASKTMNPGSTVNIQVTAKNTGSATWNPNVGLTISMHKVSNGTPQGSLPLTQIVYPPGSGKSPTTTIFNFTGTAPPPGTSKTLVFTLYRGSSAMSGTPCQTKLTTNNISTPYWGRIQTSCTTTLIQIQTAVQHEYKYVFSSPGGSYWTSSSPTGSNGGNFFWDNSAPSKASPQPPNSGGGGQQITYQGITYYWYGQVRTKQTIFPPDQVPYQVQFYDQSGNPVGGPYSSMQTATPNSGSTSITQQFPKDTYLTLGPALWPHNAYSVTLSAEVKPSDSFEQNNSSTYGDYTALDSDELPQCLHASASAACVGPNSDPGPVEPGQDFTFTYTIQLINNTDKTFSASSSGGYSIEVYTDGGLAYLAGYPASATPISRGTVNINVTIPVRVDYTGDFGVIFEFQGQRLPIDDWPGDCGVPGGPGTTGTDTPATRPYFQVWNGDAAAGGGFMNVDGTCNTTSPSYISPPTTGNQYSGGIRGFANQSSRRGSLTDFGAIALGLIQGTPSGLVGFYSSHNIYFANSGVPGGNMGGYLNSNSTAHCVPDYFTDTRINPNPPSVSGGSWSTSPNGQYTLSGNTISGGSLSAGQQITIYVNGDVDITGNITYPSTYDPNNPSNVPYFTLIAKGNITVDSGVSRLDGLYVAQPNGSGSGVFATCNGTCNGQLVVNGAVIAQQVQPLRSHGTLGPLAQDDDGLGTNPAEIFNYVPSMVIGNPYFAPEDNSPESIFSLPPVF